MINILTFSDDLVLPDTQPVLFDMLEEVEDKYAFHLEDCTQTTTTGRNTRTGPT